MPRKKKPTEPVNAPEIPPVASPLELSMVERKWLRETFSNPAFCKAWQLAHKYKPAAARRDGAYDGQFGQQIAAQRLHQILGWEMFATALVATANEPQSPYKEVPINFRQD